MIDIFNFEKTLKFNWMQKIVHQTESFWKLLESGYKLSYTGITSMGGNFPLKSQAPVNDFW